MENYRMKIVKTELSESLSNMSIGELQNFLHYSSETSEEQIELIIFEKILSRINEKAILFDSARKILGDDNKAKG